MKKGMILILLILFAVFFNARTASAFFFGGRIIYPKAIEIEELEATGFVCFVPGSTISILPIGSPAGTPVSYFIPSFVTSATRTIPTASQLILGNYLGKITLPCVLPGDPPAATTVSLDTIIYFGTSIW